MPIHLILVSSISKDYKEWKLTENVFHTFNDTSKYLMNSFQYFSYPLMSLAFDC